MNKQKNMGMTLLMGILIFLILTGCSPERENVYALKWNSMLSLDLSEDTIILLKYGLSSHRDYMCGLILYNENILENVERATVSDGTYNITLGMHFKDFVYDEEELPWDGVTVDNRFTDVVVGGFYHGIFFHPYNDITLYTSAYNLLNGDLEGIYGYVHWIVLETPRFQTSDGLRVGMTEEDLREVYGNQLIKTNVGYEFEDEDVWFDFYISPEGIIEEIRVRAKGMEVEELSGY